MPEGLISSWRLTRVSYWVYKQSIYRVTKISETFALYVIQEVVSRWNLSLIPPWFHLTVKSIRSKPALCAVLLHITEGIQVTSNYRVSCWYTILISLLVYRLFNYTFFTDFTSATSSNVVKELTTRQTLANNSMSH